jgi:hypothetical protein
MIENIPIVFAPGQTEGTDPAVLPPERLKVARNVRWRKDGRAAKKYGYAAVGFASKAGVPNCAFEHNGRKYLAGNGALRAKYGSTVASTGSIAVGDVGHFLPGEMQTVRRTESSSQPESMTVAGASGKIGYWWEENGTLYRRIHRTDGSLVAFAQFASGEIPRSVVVSGTGVVYTVYRSGTTVFTQSNDFLQDLPTIGTATNVGTLNASTDLVDAAPFTSSTYLIVYQSGANQLTAQLMTGTTVTSATNIVTVGQATALSIMGTSGENIYIAWVEAGGALKVRVFNAALTAGTGGITTVETDATNIYHQPNMVRASSTSVTLIWARFAAGGDSEMRWCSMTNAGVAGSVFNAYHVRPSSKPFLGTGVVGHVDIWVNTDNMNGPLSVLYNGWQAQREHILVTIVPGSSDVIYQLSGQPLRANASINFTQHVPDVVEVDSTWFTCLTNTLRSRASAAVTNECVAFEGLSFTDYTDSLQRGFRQSVTVGPSKFIAGCVTDVHGYHAFETGFAHFPVAGTAVVSAGGNVDSGLHYYKFVFEYFDDAGRRCRSSPSEPITATTTAGNNTVTIPLSTLAFAHKSFSSAPDLAAVRIHAYRTKAGQTEPFYRASANFGASDATGTAATVSFVDTLADANLNESLYTDGTVLPNIVPPACRYVAAVNNRLVLGGLFVPNKVVVSKLFVEGEPAQFSNSDSFALYLPEKVTGVANLDDMIVAFSENNIYLVSGDGPNDQGVGGYSDPIRVPGELGCIDHRSILETSLGLFFQSKQGIYLMPRGGGAPIFVGRDVQERLQFYPYVQSATRCAMDGDTAGNLAENTARFIVGDDPDDPDDSIVLTFDLNNNSWSQDNMALGGLGIGTMWEDRFVFCRSSLSIATTPLLQEATDVFTNAGSVASTLLSTGDIRPFGLGGWGRFQKITVVGESRETATTTMTVTLQWSIDDGQAGQTGNYTWTITESEGEIFYREVSIPTPFGCAIQLNLSDTPEGGAGVVFHGIVLEVQKETKSVRLPAGSRG